MPRRQQRQHLVPAQGQPVKGPVFSAGVQAQIRLVGVHHGVDAVRAPLDNLDFHIGIVLLKGADDVGKPVNRHAGKGCNPNMPRVRALDLRNVLLQVFIGAQ
ncbi:hypothetical protein SDC9_206952 [bioreactor metagenome]|uniref:Uncharacterized protein n=1 Tax=bioreactor metagenome TaxID=1076179 RepID=A0A645J6I7_9ZZZZ